MAMLLAQSRVLVVGVGGIGCPLAEAIAPHVASMTLVDPDVVDPSNLHRQILYTEADVGRPKVEVAKDRLRGRLASVRAVKARLTSDNAMELFAGHDLVLEGADNFGTKFLCADAALLAGTPIVHAAAVAWHGTVLSVAAGGGPCYRCIFEDMPKGGAPNCATAGVMGPVVGVVSAIALSLAAGLLESDASGVFASFDGKTDAFRMRTMRGRASCVLCGPRRRIRSLDEPRYREAACA